MKHIHQLRFIVGVLVVGGILNAIWAYYTLGASGLQSRTEVWFIASLAAILFRVLLQRLRKEAGDDEEKTKAIDMGRAAWVIFGGGAVLAAFAFGLRRSAIAALICFVTLLILVCLWLAMKQNAHS